MAKCPSKSSLNPSIKLIPRDVDVPVLLMHGEDDQIVPYELTAVKAVKLLKNGKLISYPGISHGMPNTEAARINADLLAFIKC